MRLLQSKPKQDGFSMPGEFEEHKATLMIFPYRPGSWRQQAEPAREVFAKIARIIAKEERLYMIVREQDMECARSLFSEDENIRLMEAPSNDAWARDVCPTFVRRGGVVRGISWIFNAWGGEVDGLYTDYIQDDMLAEEVCAQLGLECYDAYPFVCEGGAIHSDGEGTVMVTESCLLSPGRNPSMDKPAIEQILKDYLGAEKVIWLPCGIYQDETNEHIDNMCAFTAPGEVVLAVCENEEDPQYEMSQRALSCLERERDAKGRQLLIRQIPVPGQPICVTKEQLSGYEFAPGEAVREEGERLAASYVNYYVCNAGVLVPRFGCGEDERAIRVLQECFPEKKIYGIDSTEILLGGGNVHCITQQIPAEAKKEGQEG
ncbi:MAG: agmatine deiminase [Lachnospiraceae bacterium]|nr:agmatine deiminase [Lachnospiraceae bacterium]